MYPGAGESAHADSPPSAMLGRISGAAGIASAAAGLLVLTGWALELAALKSLAPGLASMKPNTALAFVLAGVSLWALPPQHAGRVARIAAIAGAALVAAIGALTLGEDLLGWNAGIDQLLFRDSAAAAGTAAPGRMAPATAFNFVLLGAALCLLALPTPAGYRLAQPLALIVFLVSFLALVGYAYGVDALYRVAPYTSMALHTAALSAVAAAGVLATAGDRGWVARLVSRRASGTLLRHLWLPGAAIVFLLGWLRLQGELLGLYSTAFGLALMVTLAISVLTVLAWRTARVLERSDAERSRAEQSIREAMAERARLAAIVEHSNDAIIGRALDGTITSWNAGAERMLGWTAAEALGRHFSFTLPPGQRVRIAEINEKLHRGEGVAPHETRRRTRDGRVIDVLSSVSPLRDRDGKIAGASHILHDLSALKQAESAVREGTALLRLVADNVPAMIAYTDAEFRYRYANRGFVEFYIGAGAAVEGRTIGELQGEEAQREIGPWIERCLAGEPVHYEAKRRNARGEERDVDVTLTPHRDETGRVRGAYSQVLDITERRRAEERIDYLAQVDTVTGLPNRAVFNDRLALAIARDKRLGAMTALLLLDLDRFKEINETLGQRTGDQVLRAVAARLREGLREVDTIARLGGDEFAVIIESVAEKPRALRVAEKLLEAIAEPLAIEGEEVFVTASIGIAICPADAGSAEHLTKNAELAMYQAKLDGRNAVHLYAPEAGPPRRGRLGMESRLRRAIERDELLLEFQPKVDVKSGVITGAEALLRWRNPDLGLVSPVDFIPLAEETGLIVPIGEWVLFSACAQASAWRRLGCPLAMAVNLSARQFRQKNLCEMVELALADSGLDAPSLELEITESMVMHRAELAIATLRRLRDIGVLLSVDDFGTGYSSLSYLKRFPVHKLKVDQSFVRELHNNADDAAIVRAVIALAQSLNLKTVAEGVENEQQLVYLAGLQCDEYQGYYFSKPLPAAEFLSLLRARQAAGNQHRQVNERRASV